jgi:hypothetical protein
MGYSYNDDHVRADLFTESGKWKYTVALDYSFQSLADFEHWDMAAQARRALRHATVLGVSGVSLLEIPEGWSMVVLDPHSKNSFPILVTRA